MIITKEGALASFYTTNKAPIKHLRVYFSPKQAGTGDPSPENVREIEGYNQINVELGSENLTQFSSSTTTWYKPTNFSSNYVTYYGYIDNTLGNTNVKLAARTSSTYYSDAVKPGERGAVYIHIPISNATSAQLKISNASANTVIQQRGLWPYIAENNKTINFDETIYGGYVDLVTGELIEDTIYLNMANYLADKNIEMVNGTLCRINSSYSVASPNICSHFVEHEIKNWGTMTEITGNTCWWGNGYIGFASSTLGFNTAEQWKNWLIENNVGITAKLNTPITHQLTPTQLQTLIGRNNIWSNADRVEVEYDLAESNDELYRRRNIILSGYPHIVTLEPAVLQHFSTDIAAPLKECKVHFSPIQEGSGNPSPDNVRPITGWTGLSLYHSGENLYVPNPDNKGYISSSGVINVDTTSTYTDLIPVTIGDTYSFKCTTVNVSGNTHRRIHGYNSSGTWVQQLGGGQTGANTVEDFKATVTIPSGISYIRVSFRNEDTNVRVAKEDVYEVDWEDEVETVYGGYVNLVTGEVVQEQIAKTFTILDSNQTSEHTNTMFYRFSFNVPLCGQGNTTKGITMCDVAPYGYTNNDAVHWYTTTNNANGYVYVWLPKTFSNTDTITIVATLYTPQIIATLTPIQLKTLLGTNNIWSNANGPIDIKYWTH